MGDWSMRITLSMFLRAHDRFVLAGFFARSGKAGAASAIKNVVHQRGLTRPGDSGNNRHHAERKSYARDFEIIFLRAENGQRRPILLAPLGTHLDLHFAGDGMLRSASSDRA